MTKFLIKTCFLLFLSISCTSTKKEDPTPSNTNIPTGQAPVFTIPSSGFQFRILSDTTINLSQYVSDPQNDGWDLVSGSLSADNGAVSYNNSTKELTYQSPANGLVTSDIIHFTLTDANGNTQSYNITISLINNDPYYGISYTVFTYDGVEYISLNGIALGGNTDDYTYEKSKFNINNMYDGVAYIYFNIKFYEKFFRTAYFTEYIPYSPWQMTQTDFDVYSLIGRKIKTITATADGFYGNTDPNDYAISSSMRTDGGTKVYSVGNASTDVYYIGYNEMIKEQIDLGGSKVEYSYLKGDFNILLSNGKTVSGYFKSEVMELAKYID